jgi:SAM-dependent methyltransferase
LRSVREHYDGFLGPVYSWIIGDFDTARDASATQFAALGLSPRPGAVALDLGAGPGCQALPLADLGYRVVAIDFCASLISELETRRGGRDIQTVCDDIRRFGDHLQFAPELIVCMGDTLVHLPDEAAVMALLDKVSAALGPGGRFIYAIRDYIQHEPQGSERFIPVRTTDDRIFTCFLEYRLHTVHVHDILHRKVDGAWQMEVSDYQKLRLDTVRINERLAKNGLKITEISPRNGMITVVATRPG